MLGAQKCLGTAAPLPWDGRDGHSIPRLSYGGIEAVQKAMIGMKQGSPTHACEPNSRCKNAQNVTHLPYHWSSSTRT